MSLDADVLEAPRHPPLGRSKCWGALLASTATTVILLTSCGDEEPTRSVDSSEAAETTAEGHAAASAPLTNALDRFSTDTHLKIELCIAAMPADLKHNRNSPSIPEVVKAARPPCQEALAAVRLEMSQVENGQRLEELIVLVLTYTDDIIGFQEAAHPMWPEAAIDNLVHALDRLAGANKDFHNGES